MKVIVSIDIKSIMSIDTINVVYIDMKKRNLHEGYCVYRHEGYYVYRYNKCRIYRREKNETYMKVIVSIDIKIIMSIHIITASLSMTQLAVLGGEGGWGQPCVGERDRLPAMHRLPVHREHILLTKEHTEMHPKQRIRNRPRNLTCCAVHQAKS